MTNSLRTAIEETERRRNKQRAWNEAHGITPVSIKRQIGKVLESVFEQDYVTVAPVKDTGIAEFVGKDLKSAIADLEKRMRSAAADLEFENRSASARRDPTAGGAGSRARTATGPERLAASAAAGSHAGAYGSRRWRLRPKQAPRPGWDATTRTLVPMRFFAELATRSGSGCLVAVVASEAPPVTRRHLTSEICYAPSPKTCQKSHLWSLAKSNSGRGRGVSRDCIGVPATWLKRRQ